MVIPCNLCPNNCECCGIMIFSKDFIKENEKEIERGFIEIIEKENLVSYIYEDLHCPFWNRENKLCNIYSKRMKICRDYGYIEKLQCPFYKKSGNRRSPESQRKMERKLDKQIELMNKRIGTNF
jgi:Fe-S-cluster containining protein